MDWGTALSRWYLSLRYGGPLLLLLLLGCGREVKLTPVRGQVFFHGQPLSGGTIVFTPDPERGGRGPLACGEIGPDGRYSLHTDDKPGAVPGWHRVTIAAASLASSQKGLPPVDLPRKYGDPEQSGLLRQVQADKIVEQDFHLQ